MEKVITIAGNSLVNTGEFTETEYPELNKYLENGYRVKQTISNSPKEKSNFSITFILTNV